MFCYAGSIPERSSKNIWKGAFRKKKILNLVIKVVGLCSSASWSQIVRENIWHLESKQELLPGNSSRSANLLLSMTLLLNWRSVQFVMIPLWRRRAGEKREAGPCCRVLSWIKRPEAAASASGQPEPGSAPSSSDNLWERLIHSVLSYTPPGPRQHLAA